MSTTALRIPLAEAREIADQLVALLKPACERIVVAGSIRRERPDIGDIDLVCEPKLVYGTDLFGDPTGDDEDALHDRCGQLVQDGVLEKRLNVKGSVSWGRQLKRAVYRGLSVDLQAVTDVTTWGAWLLIRTGPADFNKSIVTPIWQGGKLPAGFDWHSGFQLHRYGGRVETPTEAHVFEALGYVYQEPQERGIVPLRLLGQGVTP